MPRDVARQRASTFLASATRTRPLASHCVSVYEQKLFEFEFEFEFEFGVTEPLLAELCD